MVIPICMGETNHLPLDISYALVRRIVRRRTSHEHSKDLSYRTYRNRFARARGAATKLVARQTAQQNQQQKASDDSGKNQNMPGMDNSMPGMDMDHDMPGMKMGQGSDEKDQQTEHGAMDAMSHMHHHQMGPHMYMTKLRTATPQDWAKADEIAGELRESIEKVQGLPRRARRRLPHFHAESSAVRVSLHELLQRIPRIVQLRSDAPHFPALQENENRLRPDRRDVHHAQARVGRTIERARPAQHRAVAPAHQALHASQGSSAATPTSPSSACKARSSPRKPAPRPAARSTP